MGGGGRVLKGLHRRPEQAACMFQPRGPITNRSKRCIAAAEAAAARRLG